MTQMNKWMVDAIRADELVGKGTCSVVDECHSDEELVALLVEAGVNSPLDAIDWAHDVEGLSIESGLNARWGEDSDPQLAAAKEWFQKCHDHFKGGGA